jgi:hypothetical protein
MQPDPEFRCHVLRIGKPVAVFGSKATHGIKEAIFIWFDTVPPLTTAASLRCFPRRLVISRERRLVRRIALVSSSGYGMTILAA